MRAGPLRCSVVQGGSAIGLAPFDSPTWVEALKQFAGKSVFVTLEDEKGARTRQQERFWWGIAVPAVIALWKQKHGWTFPDSAEAAKQAVHDIYVRTLFGEIETPKGKARRSSTTLSIEEYTRLIDAAAEDLRLEGIHLPEQEPA